MSKGGRIAAPRPPDSHRVIATGSPDERSVLVMASASRWKSSS